MEGGESSSSDPLHLLQVALQNAQSLNGCSPLSSDTPPAFLDPATKHARKIYVGNLPVVATEQSLKQFFNEALVSLLPNQQNGSPVVSCYINVQRRFAFLEHRSIEEANFTLGLDGIQFAGHALKLRRPQDYNAGLAEIQMRLGSGVTIGIPDAVQPRPPTNAAALQGDLVAGALGIISTTVEDSPNKVFIGGLPHHLSESDVKQILSAFGALKSFHLVKAQPAVPGEPEKSKGFAFCEWRDSSVTENACQALNGMKIGDRTLNVRRAVPHAVHKATALGVTPQQATAMGFGTSAVGTPCGLVGGAVPGPSTSSAIGRISRFISITNMLPPIVTDPSVVDDTLAEAELECSASGRVRSAHWQGEQVFVELASTKDAVKVLSHLQGKLFDGRQLICTFAEATAEMRKAAVDRILMEANREHESLLEAKRCSGFSLKSKNIHSNGGECGLPVS